MKTKTDLRRRFRGMHDIFIPAGTPCIRVAGGAGGWAVDPGLVTLESKTESLFKHDSTYYYIWIGAEHLQAT